MRSLLGRHSPFIEYGDRMTLGKSLRMRRLAPQTTIAALTLVVLIGCSVPKVPVPTGGSRADGTVRLAYEYGLFEVPQVDWVSARGTAAERCRAWGYTDAEP